MSNPGIDRWLEEQRRMAAENEPLAILVDLPDGNVGMEVDGKVYAIEKAKPWEEMTEAERKEHIDAGVRFVMGDD